jgi:predicted peroxiredoxin
MRLAIVINSDRNLRHVVGLTTAAVGRGHQVSLFAMDAGTRLLADPACARLSALPGVSMSVCEHSAASQGVSREGLPGEIVWGSQYHNAVMTHDADRVLIL